VWGAVGRLGAGVRDLGVCEERGRRGREEGHGKRVVGGRLEGKKGKERGYAKKRGRGGVGKLWNSSGVGRQ